MNIKPYIIIPNLIPQPTWGGDYIATHKGLPNDRIGDKRIGQSYELYLGSQLSQKITTKDYPSIEFGHPDNPEKTAPDSKDDSPFPLQQLINTDPKGVLGTKALALFGEKMDILIKYTQAKGNSFQLHVQNKSGAWIPKPESWYYLEPGSITLGVKTGVNWDEYQEECVFINDQVTTISKEMVAGKMSATNAQEAIQSLLTSHDIYRFVNQLDVSKNTAIDLSAGGIHHSWEDNPDQPWGNIVYEIQKNAYDPVSSIRSFDKGKLKPDGTVRQLQIDDYFNNIDRSLAANTPTTHMKNSKIVTKTAENEVNSIFETPLYTMHQITLLHENSQFHGTTDESFHHVFVQSGTITLTLEGNEPYQINQGFGVFIPAACTNYLLESISPSSVIFKTFVS